VVVRSGTGAALGSERLLEAMLAGATRAIVVRELYPNTALSGTVHVLHGDGAVTAAALNALTLALVDAGVALRGLACGAVVAAQGSTLLLDPTEAEEDAAQGACFLALLEGAADEKDGAADDAVGAGGGAGDGAGADRILVMDSWGRCDKELQLKMTRAAVSAAKAAANFARVVLDRRTALQERNTPMETG